ncbi:FG-GAP-like repeat-containing protein [Namhaeicola litoreus]|uniref:FG-GAP-like repeat-containing protein n=1 Tax=Namhaeicola litoreus TaxID=1052145 RepID=A0ABW3Y1A0_9FLAO
MKTYLHLILTLLTFNVISQTKINSVEAAIEIQPSKPVIKDYKVLGSLTKKIFLDIVNDGEYAGLTVYENDNLLIDDFNLAKKGVQRVTGVVRFEDFGDVKLRFQAHDQKLTLLDLYFEDVPEIQLPVFNDISISAGIDKVSSLKYAGPSIGDIDNDGDYDFILNNHNAETSKLYWNNGDGTVTKHYKDLARWFKHDLHGTALGDYDNDGDLDLVLTQGGGNGKNPSKANFYHNDNNTFVMYTGDVEIDRGGRGRGARWMDMDLDGDLDLFLFNEASLNFDRPQHFFYENKGNGKFNYRSIKDIENIEQSRVLVTDFNNDNIDDIVFYGPLTLWKGNGDFTFTEVTALIPEHIKSLSHIMAMTDIDIDNDGDLDLYLARGMHFEGGEGESPSLDFNPITKELDLKTRGYKGNDAFDFSSGDTILLHKYYYLEQGSLLGKNYPIFLGKNKISKTVKSGDELEITTEMAKGWPDEISENGFYLGYIGNSIWKAILVRDDNFFWQYRFGLSGVTSVAPNFVPQNRNHSDYLLRNDGDRFTDVSEEWNIPQGGNTLGVTSGDFNNDSHQDLFVYRWGRIGARISDFMLLNSGKNSFEITTMHGASDVGGPGNGDMGQAFDFDLDGRIDLLNGSEGGEWYLYSNNTRNRNNYVLVRVGYAPTSHIDAVSAEVIVTTENNQYKKRIGSAGEVFSQSLLNIVHFGLGKEENIKQIQITWRNGEVIKFKDKKANTIYDTDYVDPDLLNIEPLKIREKTKAEISVSVQPKNANTDVTWTSSNEKVLTVDNNGMVSAIGKKNKKAKITATSKANGLSATTDVKIIKWFPKPVKSIILHADRTKLYTGESYTIKASVLPKNADNPDLIWKSNNVNILTVDRNGNVKALAPGKTTIAAYTTDKSVNEEVEFEVEQFIEPYVEIVNKGQIESEPLVVGDDLDVVVKYHAGSGNRVISADEGGIRFWLRHFKSKWIPVKDNVLTYEEALNTVSGKASMTISLDGITPTKDLLEGHFYQLRVTFTSSDGNMYFDDILPLHIVSKK